MKEGKVETIRCDKERKEERERRESLRKRVRKKEIEKVTRI
jgi:hypothetical protein